MAATISGNGSKRAKKGPGQLADHPLCRRFRRHGAAANPPAGRGAARGGSRRPGTARTAARRRENPRGPHRRGLRLPRLHHPPNAETRNAASTTSTPCPSKKAIQAVKDKVAAENVQGNPEPGPRRAPPEREQDPGRDGRITSGTACPKPSSTLSTPTRGAASCAGCGGNTKDAPGSECQSCGGASASPEPGYSQSTGPGSPARQPCRSPATATAERGYPPRGHPIRRQATS